MESMKSRTRNQSRLVGDPEMADSVKSVDEYNPLFTISVGFPRR